jgi:hypothetical protein
VARSSAPKTFVEFFLGIGLIHCALEPLGWNLLLANDIDEGKARTYRNRYVACLVRIMQRQVALGLFFVGPPLAADVDETFSVSSTLALTLKPGHHRLRGRGAGGRIRPAVCPAVLVDVQD